METLVVECYSGGEYAERPVALVWGGQRREIKEVLQRWRNPAGKGFRVEMVEGEIFELFFEESSDEWHVRQL